MLAFEMSIKYSRKNDGHFLAHTQNTLFQWAWRVMRIRAFLERSVEIPKFYFIGKDVLSLACQIQSANSPSGWKLEAS